MIVYILHCKLEGCYTNAQAVEQARQLVLSEPEKYLTVSQWTPQEYELPYINFVDDKAEAA